MPQQTAVTLPDGSVIYHSSTGTVPARTPHPAALAEQNVANLAGAVNSIVGARGMRYFVDVANGSDSNTGRSWAQAFASMTPLTALLAHHDIIYLSGSLRQNWIAPAKNDVTIIGVGNKPRQATSDGVANGGGATWLNPVTVDNDAALIALGDASTTLETQGWRFVNIFFSNAATGTGCVRLTRRLAGADPSHASFYGCDFTGASSGLLCVDGSSHLKIVDCNFYNFAGAGDTAIKVAAGEGVALPLQWIVTGNNFWNNVNHLVAALSSARVEGNNFGIVGSSITTTKAIDLAGGKNNSIVSNIFNRPLDTAGNAALYAGGTADAWSHNYGTTGIFYGVPDDS